MERASLRALLRLTRASVAAPATNPVAATAAACTAGSDVGLNRYTGRTSASTGSPSIVSTSSPGDSSLPLLRDSSFIAAQW